MGIYRQNGIKSAKKGFGGEITNWLQVSLLDGKTLTNMIQLGKKVFIP